MTKNVVTGIFTIIIGIVYLIMTLQLAKPALGDRIGPRLFPIMIGMVTVICGVILLLNDLRSKKREYVKINYDANREIYFKIGSTIILGILYGLVLETVGYLIASFVFVLAIMLVVNNFSRITESVLVSLGFSVISYVVFFSILHLSLPRGWLALF